MKPPIPDDEAERIQTLREFEILDTEAEKVFDDLTRLAAYICKTPISLITLIDSDRQWFKSKIGLSENETARDISFCAHTIVQTEALVINNATQDKRFKKNPLVADEPHIRFYAGAPLTTSEGYKLGALCVIDCEPREISVGQLAALKTLSYQVVTQLELRRKVKELQRALDEEKQKVHKLQTKNLENSSADFRNSLSD